MDDLLGLLLPEPILLLLLLAVLAGCAFWIKPFHPLHRIRFPLLVAVIWAWLFTTPRIANFLIAATEGSPGSQQTLVISPRNKNSLIVVLASGSMRTGSGQPRPRLDAHGWERLYAGLQLWRQTGGTLLLTGGPSEYPDQSLAALMRRIALNFGVPANSIIISPHSDTTYEDLLSSRDEILSHKGDVWLVTSAMHMPRAEGVSSKLGLKIIPWRCDYQQIVDPTWRAWLPDSGATKAWVMVLHEIVGQQYYRFKGWSN